MTIELVKRDTPAKTVYRGNGSVTIPAGKTLKIKTSPKGEEVLVVEVPAGEEWVVNLGIDVIVK